MKSLGLKLPWPPSVNRYWRHYMRFRRGPPRTQYIAYVLDTPGKQYRELAAQLVMLQTRDVKRVSGKFFHGPLRMIINASPPDKRVRDLDNILKGPLDAMEACGIYTNDYQICDLQIKRIPPVKGGCLWVWIETAAIAANDDGKEEITE